MTNATIPQNGWALPVPATGWGGLPPTGSSAMTGGDQAITVTMATMATIRVP